MFLNVSQLRHLDQNAELVIDTDNVEDFSEKIAISYVSPGDEGQVLVTLANE